MRQDHIYLDTKSAEWANKIVVDILLKKAAAYIKKRKVIWFGIFGEDNRKRKGSGYSSSTYSDTDFIGV